MLAALAEGGFTGTDAVHAFDTLLMFTFGSVHCEIPRTTDARVRERLVAVAIGDEAAIHIIERANELSQREPTEYFEVGLNTILDGLRAGRKLDGASAPEHSDMGADERSDPAATPANDG